MELSIERFVPSDGSDAAFLLTMNFGGKFQKLTDLEPGTLSSLVKEEFFDQYSEEHEICFVAKNNETAIGLIFLEWGEQPKRKRSFISRCRKYGIRNTIRFSKGMRAMKVTETEGNCYLAKLSVAEEFRGKGTATQLIEKAIEFAKDKGFRNMTLYVSTDNDKARSLYERFGFETVKTVKTTSERSFGVTEWAYMKLPL